MEGLIFVKILPLISESIHHSHLDKEHGQTVLKAKVDLLRRTIAPWHVCSNRQLVYIFNDNDLVLPNVKGFHYMVVNFNPLKFRNRGVLRVILLCLFYFSAALLYAIYQRWPKLWGLAICLNLTVVRAWRIKLWLGLWFISNIPVENAINELMTLALLAC